MTQQISTQIQQKYTAVMKEAKELLDASFGAIDLTFKAHLSALQDQTALNRAINSSKNASDALNKYCNRLEMMLNLTQTTDQK